MTGLLKLRLRAMRLAALPILRSLLMLAKNSSVPAFTPPFAEAVSWWAQGLGVANVRSVFAKVLR
jgi:hypothetical protein